jgi:hypothetical protein
MLRNTLAPLLIFLLRSALAGQGIVSVSAPRRAEIGVARQVINRTIRYTDGSRQNADWGREVVFLRVTLTAALSFAIDGVAWHQGATRRFPNRDYFDFSFGAGATVLPFRYPRSSVGLSIHYHDLNNFDQSSERSSKRSSQLLLSAFVTRGVQLGRVRGDVWVGPAYVIDWLRQYPPVGPVQRGKSVNNAAALLGGSALLKRRLRFFAQLLYPNHWQSEVGVGFIV